MTILVPTVRPIVCPAVRAIDAYCGGVAAPAGPPLGEHQYWRIEQITPGGGAGIELSELLLLTDASTEVASMTWTASTVPTPNVWARATDGLYAEGLYWSDAVVIGGLQIDCDCGVPTAVTHVKQGGFDNSARFMVGAKIFASDDDITYTQVGFFGAQTYPGDNTLGPAIEIEVYVPEVFYEHTYRYWEFRTIVTPGLPGSVLEFAQLEMVNDDVRHVPTDITSSVAPNVGALTLLTDDNLSTRPYWLTYPADLIIQLDLGSSKLCDGWKFAGYDTNSRYPRDVDIFGSDDDIAYTQVSANTGTGYPGNNTRTATLALNVAP